jgi:2-polyprenyl-3-methyl-5-hydroxy-6-metoxy-1,4-benzoquinol methylase
LNSSNSCPLCDSGSFRPWRWDLLRCDTCSVVLNPAVWEPHVNEVMEEDWFGEDYTIPKTSVWVNWFEARNNRRTFLRIQEEVIEPGRMLEVGIGSGAWLGFMKRQGWAVLGVDLSQAVCNAAQARWQVPTHCGVVETLPQTATYDLVVMNHVLEHVQEPIRMLAEVRRRMRPGGLLHLAVPNVGCWEARFSGWTSYEPYHLLYFTPETLRTVVEKTGFRVEKVQTHESFSGWFLVGVRSLTGHSRKTGQERQRQRSRHLRSNIEDVYRIAMVSSGILTWPIRGLQQALGKGDEVIVMARS